MTDFLEKAKKHWTQDRVKKVTGGKKLLVTPDRAPELLRVMGLLNNDASMSANDVRKFRQINHMLALIHEDLAALTKNHPTIRTIDIGCGNSYMTLMLTWYFKEVLKHPFECVGIDSNQKVIEKSIEKSKSLEYENFLKFQLGDIRNFTWKSLYETLFSKKDTRPNLVIALHACDIATDYALAFGIQNKADYIAAAPCCQAELASKWKSLVNEHNPFSPIFRSHHFRREIASEITDVMRMLLVRSRGYEVTATEFVGQEHAMKNRLLTCIRRGSKLPDALEQFENLKNSLGSCSISLEKLLGINF